MKYYTKEKKNALQRLALPDVSQVQWQTAFYLPEGDFDTQGQEKGQNNGGRTFSKV